MVFAVFLPKRKRELLVVTIAVEIGQHIMASLIIWNERLGHAIVVGLEPGLEIEGPMDVQGEGSGIMVLEQSIVQNPMLSKFARFRLMTGGEIEAKEFTNFSPRLVRECGLKVLRTRY